MTKKLFVPQCFDFHRKGSAMVLLDRVLATSYRLSIVTLSQSAAVWMQFLR